MQMLAWIAITAIYNIWMHPLRKYPGPRLWAASDIPYILMTLRGRPHEHVLRLHRQYGEIVRLAPNELSFIGPDAWSEIMSLRQGHQENNKDPAFMDPTSGSILSVCKDEHARIRRILGDGFSPRAIKSYEPALDRHVASLIKALQHQCFTAEGPIDLVDYYNLAMTDFAYEMVFGFSFGCLDNQRYPECVAFAFARAKLGTYYRTLLRLPGAALAISYLTPKSVVREALQYKELLEKQVSEHQSSKHESSDLVGLMRKGKGPLTMSIKEISTNTEVLIIGGSETTASGLSAMTFLLASHPNVMNKLEEEIFSAYKSEDEISMSNVVQLEFLGAVVYESLRLYPPGPVAFPRKTPPTGSKIFDDYIPGNTILGIWQWAAYHSERNFSQPFAFLPERWLDAKGFESDRKAVFKPFSFGTRNCIGQSLAMYQLHYIILRLLWNFEIKLAEQSKTWLDQDVFTLWQKKPLSVYIVPRARA
ncbi:isotrichodermin C-15 hydroxylase [Teratosphaeria nubilosa]|uniref:Isotrichodermin C-15 hydroxylase n=1 Tax=Teratosphaeria nubilosa TaxID=161662 RepID=A0A6G1L7H0_9PEZI|nr:isotrichodermin C-15 hydroxylase [Teratosphaeria nubilosa]